MGASPSRKPQTERDQAITRRSGTRYRTFDIIQWVAENSENCHNANKQLQWEVDFGGKPHLAVMG